MLQTTDSAAKTRRVLQQAAEDHSKAKTPYGPLVQKLVVPGMDEPMEYCDPPAYIRYLSTLNAAFGDIMKACLLRQGNKLTVIMYLDEIVPGNPFRQDKARKMWGIYWCCLEWPGWLLSRSAAWPVFCIIRSKSIDGMPGGLSAFWAYVLECCFPAGGQFDVQIVHRDDRLRLAFEYGGTMADEAALKGIHNYKGASGIKPCMDCACLVKTTDENVLPPGLVSLGISSLAGVVANTNNDIWEMADIVHDLATRGRSYTETQKLLGLTYNPSGLLYKRSLRQIHRPIDHYIRDWMHIIVNGGVANTQTFYVIDELKSHGVQVELVQQYSLEVTLAKKYGKVSKTWLDKARFGDGKNFNSFASYMLNLMPIVLAFLLDCVQPQDIMHSHIKCYQLLVDIVGLLTSGADYAVQHMDLLATLIQEHHDLYKELYPGCAIKPKWHHMIHLPSLYKRLNKVISCFVTERKHKAVKGAALFVFRNLEHTVMASVINEQCEQAKVGHSLFLKHFLVHPSDIDVLGVCLKRSSNALLECGILAAGDVVYILGGVLGRLECFWQLGEHITAQINKCKPLQTAGHYRDSDGCDFVSIDLIVDAVSHRLLEDGSFRVLLPFKARFG
jgi:hypothetical protein